MNEREATPKIPRVGMGVRDYHPGGLRWPTAIWGGPKWPMMASLAI